MGNLRQSKTDEEWDAMLERANNISFSPYIISPYLSREAHEEKTKILKGLGFSYIVETTSWKHRLAPNDYPRFITHPTDHNYLNDVSNYLVHLGIELEKTAIIKAINKL